MFVSSDIFPFSGNSLVSCLIFLRYLSHPRIPSRDTSDVRQHFEEIKQEPNCISSCSALKPIWYAHVVSGNSSVSLYFNISSLIKRLSTRLRVLWLLIKIEQRAKPHISSSRIKTTYEMNNL